MGQLLEDLIKGCEAETVRRGAETFLEPALAAKVIRAAAAAGIRTLGLEGFLVDEDWVYPALSRIADASNLSATEAAHRLLGLLEGDWADAPTASDQLHGDAMGRHMVVVVLEE